MRGKGRLDVFGRVSERITPAYAGKSVNGLKLIPNVEDHPRLCGEKLHQDGYIFVTLGSPPPMRGKAWGGAHGARLK